MEHGTFKLAENLNGTKELVKIVGETRLDTLLIRVWEQHEFGLFPLWFWWEAGVHIEISVSYNPGDARYDEGDEE